MEKETKTSTYFSQLMAKCELVQYIFIVSFRQRRFHMRERGMTFWGLRNLHYYARLKKKQTHGKIYKSVILFGAHNIWCR